jgi:hypothetical protein
MKVEKYGPWSVCGMTAALSFNGLTKQHLTGRHFDVGRSRAFEEFLRQRSFSGVVSLGVTRL